MYRVRIDTDMYKPRRCNEYNWEPGTMNDYMAALNGWQIIEPNLQCVRWRIAMFVQNTMENNWDEKKSAYTDQFSEWNNNRKNKVYYHDKLRNIRRVSEVKVFGLAQGNFNVEEFLETLEAKGTINQYDAIEVLETLEAKGVASYSAVKEIFKTLEIECTANYIDIEGILRTLETEGSVKIPFAWAYDVKQYSSCMDGCYMEIIKE